MRTFNVILTCVLVFGLAMAVVAKIDNQDERYDPIHHLAVIADGFKDIPSFDELTTYTASDAFLIPVSESWRFRGFYVAETADFIVVYPDAIRNQDWGAFEWINEPLGAIVSFFVRSNAVVWWLTEWCVDFFGNVYVLFPSAGMVERGS